MNVLQLISSTGFYGAERWVLALANNLDPELVNCSIAATSEDPVRNIELLEHFEKMGGTCHRIELKHRFDVTAVTRICEVIKAQKIDIIHSHGYKSDLLSVFSAKKTGIKCVTTPHGFGDQISLKLKLFIKLGCFSFRYFDSIVPLSPQLLEEVNAMHLDAEKIRYIRNGVDLKELWSTETSNAIEPRNDSSKRTIGFVGQMIPRKEIHQLLRAFDLLWQRNSQLHLVLVGDGQQKEELVNYSKNLSCSQNIEFTGFRSDRIELMKKFDVFVMTSSSEGIPRCLMESMALEIPVVAYDIAGIDQLIENRKTGLLVNFGDIATLVDTIDTVLNNPEVAMTLARNASQFINDKYSAVAMAKSYTDLYLELVGEKDVS